ncbi:MAG: ABC transporter permease [Planctomycetota bacterium]|nr:MAG: ABC transporter permease [Planctomycetota bacterium]
MKTALPSLLWREVESLFFAPLAYIVLTIFLFLSGFSFVKALGEGAGEVGRTVEIFLGGGHWFWLCMLLLPPLITMRLVAEERRSGQLEVLLTAPVRDGEVVLAKFLGALIFQCFLWAPTLLHILLLRNYGALPAVGQLVTSYVGLTCVLALLTSVGLVFSILTSNQIVAAAASTTFNLVFFALPIAIDEIGIDWLVSPLRSVSMFEHFTSGFSKGVLDSSVLVFYASATLAMLVVATRSLEARKWR